MSSSWGEVVGARHQFPFELGIPPCRHFRNRSGSGESLAGGNGIRIAPVGDSSLFVIGDVHVRNYDESDDSVCGDAHVRDVHGGSSCPYAPYVGRSGLGWDRIARTSSWPSRSSESP